MMFLYDVLGTPTRRLFLAAVASSTLARAGTAARPVVVGSKLDLEGGLLGEMMLLALGQAKIAAENRLRMGPTSILRSALLSGAVDLCPEYTANAAFFFHEDGDPLWKDGAAGYDRAKKQLGDRGPGILGTGTKSSHHGRFRPLCAGRQ
jgi:osmoprotectant transport system substrate-binding protein